MYKHFTFCVLLFCVFGWFAIVGSRQSSGSSFGHTTNAIFYTGVAGMIAFGSFCGVVANWHRTVPRNYLILAGILSVLSLSWVLGVRLGNRLKTVRELETAHATISELGLPFPMVDQAARYFENIPAEHSVGYWVSSDRTQFEVYYHYSSDSFTMPYPGIEWEWRGYNYAGPRDKEE